MSDRASHVRDLPVFLRAPRAAGLWLIGTLITLASLVAFGLSYRGLFEWALHHQWPAVVAVFFPLLIDVLIVVCEVILFVAAIDGDTPRHVRGLAWVVLLVFTGLSVVGNADHAATADMLTRGGFALPPLVLAVALGFGLGELKRQAAKYRPASARASGSAFVKPKLPVVRQIQHDRACGQHTAQKIQDALRTRDSQWAQAVERGRGGPVHQVTAPAAAPAGVAACPPAGTPAGALSNGQVTN